MFSNNKQDNESTDKRGKCNCQELKEKINNTVEEINKIRFEENQKREDIDKFKKKIVLDLDQDNKRFQEILKLRERQLDKKLENIDKSLEDALLQGDTEKIKELLAKLV